MLLKQKKVNYHKCGVNFKISGTHTSPKNHRFSVHPSFVDRCLFVGERTNSGLTDEQQDSTHPLVATRQVSSAPRRRACEIGDRWPLQDWTFGPCCLRNQPPSRPFSRIFLTNEVEMLKFKNTHMDAK